MGEIRVSAKPAITFSLRLISALSGVQYDEKGVVRSWLTEDEAGLCVKASQPVRYRRAYYALWCEGKPDGVVDYHYYRDGRQRLIDSIGGSNYRPLEIRARYVQHAIGLIVQKRRASLTEVKLLARPKGERYEEIAAMLINADSMGEQLLVSRPRQPGATWASPGPPSQGITDPCRQAWWMKELSEQEVKAKAGTSPPA